MSYISLFITTPKKIFLESHFLLRDNMTTIINAIDLFTSTKFVLVVIDFAIVVDLFGFNITSCFFVSVAKPFLGLTNY